MQLTHITINTGRLEESVAFYQNILGLNIARDMRGKGTVNIVFLNDGSSDVCIELVANKEHSYEGSGISVGFATDDLDKSAQELKSKGITTGKIIVPNLHTRFFFIEDPNGVQIQFIESKRRFDTCIN